MKLWSYQSPLNHQKKVFRSVFTDSENRVFCATFNCDCKQSASDLLGHLDNFKMRLPNVATENPRKIESYIKNS